MNTHKKYIIQMENLCKAYDGRVILGDIDLKIAQGEFVTVVGPSGCGKSTLLRLILGMEKPTSATCFLVDGNEVEKPDYTRGVVFQNYSLCPHLTALGNVLLGKKVHKGPWNYIENRKRYLEEAHFFLGKVGLKEHMHKRPGKLSGGQQQRAAIAQALIMKSKILLMDEPFGALDVTTRAEMQQFMLDLWKETGMTIHLVTNELDAGPIVCQKSVPVDSADTPATLKAKVQALEKKWYPEVIRWFAAGMVKFHQYEE